MNAFFAASPILLIVVLMVGLRWSAAAAGFASLCLAAGLALSVFGGAADGPALLAGAFAEAVFTALTILWILWPALAIYELQTRTGTMDVLRGALTASSAKPATSVLMVGWFFALFFEGAAGFGTPVALAAPLLVAFGVPAVKALSITLVGHAAGVSFGAVGTPVVAQAALTGVASQELSPTPAVLTALVGTVLLIAMLRLAGVEPRAIVLQGAPAYAAFMIPFVAIAWLLGPELPTLLGAFVGGSLFYALSTTAASRTTRPSAAAHAAAPYLVLIALVMLTRLVPDVRDALSGIELTLSFLPGSTVAFAPLYHPGTLLAVAFLIGALLQRAEAQRIVRSAQAAAGRLVPVLLALVVMLAVARVLVHAGMVETLADGLARATGNAWPVAAPFVGALGTFVTGSATASNVLFSELQGEVARTLSLPVVVILGAQTFGAAIGNMIAPHNIVAGCATVGLARQEGTILRATLPIALTAALIAGAATSAIALLR